jgi:transposase-like protein
LAEADSSGLSVAEYARREGISEKRLYSWRSRLAARRPSDVRGHGSAKPRAPAFVPAVVVDRSIRAAPARDTATGVDVVLRSGLRLRIGADFDAATLVRLVEALEGSSC